MLWISYLQTLVSALLCFESGMGFEELLRRIHEWHELLNPTPEEEKGEEKETQQGEWHPYKWQMLVVSALHGENMCLNLGMTVTWLNLFTGELNIKVFGLTNSKRVHGHVS